MGNQDQNFNLDLNPNKNKVNAGFASDNPKHSYFNTFFLAFTYIYFILNITEKLHCAVILLYNFSLKLHKMYIFNFVKVLEIQDYLCIKKQKRQEG